MVAAEQTAEQPEERELLESVRAGYQEYRGTLGRGPDPPTGPWSREQLLRWADAHRSKQLEAQCEKLVKFNNESMAETAAASVRIGDRARHLMLLVGLLGPLSGLIGGYLIARGLSHTLTRLVVRMQDLHGAGPGGGHPGFEGRNALARPGSAARSRGRAHAAVVVQAQERQQEMLRAEQLAAVGQLAASMAHEVRNPLTSIKLLIGAARLGGDLALSREDLEVMHQEIGA